MNADIQPKYEDASVRCSCGNTFTTRSTRSELRVELCNECHPFFTGKQKLVDTGGRVERFERRYGARGKAGAAGAGGTRQEALRKGCATAARWQALELLFVRVSSECPKTALERFVPARTAVPRGACSSEEPQLRL